MRKQESASDDAPERPSGTSIKRPHWSQLIGKSDGLLRPSARTKLRVSERLPVVRLEPGMTMESMGCHAFDFLDDDDLLRATDGALPSPSTDQGGGGATFTDPAPSFLTESTTLARHAPLNAVSYVLDDEDYNWCIDVAADAEQVDVDRSACGPDREGNRRTVAAALSALFDTQTGTEAPVLYLSKALSHVFTRLERQYATNLLQYVSAKTGDHMGHPMEGGCGDGSPSSVAHEERTVASGDASLSCRRCGVCGALIFPTLPSHGHAYCGCGRGELLVHHHCGSVIASSLINNEWACQDDGATTAFGNSSAAVDRARYVRCVMAGVMTCSPCWLEEQLGNSKTTNDDALVCRLCDQLLLPNISAPAGYAAASSHHRRDGDFLVAPLIPALIRFPLEQSTSATGATATRSTAVHALCAAAALQSTCATSPNDAPSSERMSNQFGDCSTDGPLRPCVMCGKVGGGPLAGAALRRCPAQKCQNNIHLLCAAKEGLLSSSWFARQEAIMPPPVAGTDIDLPYLVLQPYCPQHRGHVGVQAPHALLAAYAPTYGNDGKSNVLSTLSQVAAADAVSMMHVSLESDADDALEPLIPSSVLAGECAGVGELPGRPPKRLRDDQQAPNDSISLTSEEKFQIRQVGKVLTALWMHRRDETVAVATLLLDNINKAKAAEDLEPDLAKRYAAQCARKQKYLLDTDEKPRCLLRKVSRDAYVLSQHVSLIPELHDYLSDFLDGTPLFAERLDFGPGEESRRMRLNRQGNSTDQLNCFDALQGPIQQLSALTRLVHARAEREHDLVLLRVRSARMD